MAYVIYTDGIGHLTDEKRKRKVPRTIFGVGDDPVSAMEESLTWLSTDGTQDIYMQYFRVAKIDDSTEELLEGGEETYPFTIRDGNLILGDEFEDVDQ